MSISSPTLNNMFKAGASVFWILLLFECSNADLQPLAMAHALSNEQTQGPLANSKTHGAPSSGGGSSRCEVITIPMCRGIGYNVTSMPNELNHDTQEEAGLEVHQFWPLVEIKCSPDLLFFLCSMYAPICIEEYLQPLPPCQSVCERAKAGCAPLMLSYGFSWPDKMACDKFPQHNDPENLCMEQPDHVDLSSHELETASASTVPKPTKKPSGSKKSCPAGKTGKQCKDSLPGGSFQFNTECSCKCKPPLLAIQKESQWYNRSSVSVAGITNCAFPCHGVFFNPEEREFATLWIGLWSGLCCVSTLMTLTTFLIDTERFKYPERPIVFLSACYFMVSIGYLIRVFLGHDRVACDGLMIQYSASGPIPCTLVFLLIYFFGMASSIWWVVLSFTWFLAAGLKWGNEAITSYSQCFHLAAWLIPTIKSIGVLVMAAVDGDPVAGICYVGNHNADNLRLFVLGPLMVYLFLGTSFLLGGFVSLFRIRNVIKQQGGLNGRSKADKLEKLMIRIGIFSVLYTVPATIVLACHLYETTFYLDWMKPLVCSCNEPAVLNHRTRFRPVYSVLMLKYFMTLAVGITSGVWIWSSKTLGSWKRLWRKIFGSSTSPRPVLINPGVGNPGQKRMLVKQYGIITTPSPGPGTCGSLLGPLPHIVPNAHGAHHYPSHLVANKTPLSHV